MNNKTFYSIAAAAIITSIVFWGYMFQDSSSTETVQNFSGEKENISLTMYHSPTCQCCVKWAEYLENHGVDVSVEPVNNISGVKEEHGVPNHLSSCHTAVVDGYVIEGHVPVEDIVRLLEERPDAVGLSVPGMPVNSPGMDMPSDESYQSVLFDEENVTVFNTHH